MTIYDIKAATAEADPHFFDRSTLRAFSQTMKSFSVQRAGDGIWFITAPRFYRGDNGRPVQYGATQRWYYNGRLYHSFLEAQAARDHDEKKEGAQE